jgi:hypothetical protein
MKYTSFIFHPKIKIVYFASRYIHPSISTPKYTSFISHPNIYTHYFPPQYIHLLFCTPIYTPVILHPNIYTLYFPPHLDIPKGSHLIFSGIITFSKKGNEYVSPFYIQFFWQSIISSHGFAPFFFVQFCTCS